MKSPLDRIKTWCGHLLGVLAPDSERRPWAEPIKEVGKAGGEDKLRAIKDIYYAWVNANAFNGGPRNVVTAAGFLTRIGGVLEDPFVLTGDEPTAAPCEREAGVGEDFRPGLPPLELRRVWREWEDEDGDVVTFSADGMRRRWSAWPPDEWASAEEHWFKYTKLRPHKSTYAHVESLAAAKVANPTVSTVTKRIDWGDGEVECVRVQFGAPAAKVAADKQPWERELERLTAAGPPVFTRKDNPLRFALRELYALRAVVESGQGSISVPASVVAQLPLNASRPWTYPYILGWVGKEGLLSALHAAGNEMVKGGGG